jgi:proteasome accessory factor A
MDMGALDDVPEMSHPLEDMWHNVEVTNPEKWKVRLKDGSTVGPVDIQRYYLEKVEAKGLIEDDNDRMALKLWEGILDDIQNKRSKKLARKVEWLDRYFAIQEQVKVQPDDLEVEMRAAKGYSEMALGRGLHYKRMRKGLIDRLLSDEEVIEAIYEPPKDTRAALRRKLCEEHEVVRMDWSYIEVRGEGGFRKIEMPDPWEAG